MVFLEKTTHSKTPVVAVKRNLAETSIRNTMSQIQIEAQTDMVFLNIYQHTVPTSHSIINQNHVAGNRKNTMSINQQLI